MKSLFSGVSGLKNHTVRMDVIGNNIANVNTTAYKGNSVTFRDVFYQTRTFASSGTNVSGGVNPRQVGYGLAMGSVDKVMTQSGFTFSDSVYDCAIQGEGFFQVMDASGNIYYTRNGVFNVDNFGNLVDSNGYIVLGVSGDPTGVPAGSQRINLMIPDVQNEFATAVKTVTIDGWDYEIEFEFHEFGPQGNIAINIVHNEVPFATMSGSVLTVQMDLTQDYVTWGTYDAAGVFTPSADQANPPAGAVSIPNPDGFQDAVNAAIRAGGIDLGSNNPLTITFPAGAPTTGTPPVSATDRVSATNTFAFDDNIPTLHGLTFTAPAGLAGNRVEVNLAVSSSASARTVVARWSGDVLTVTVPQAGNLTLPTAGGATTVEEAIQEAIDAAARDDARRMITVTATGTFNDTVTGGTPDANNLANLIGGRNMRIGLSGGRDNFYRTMATQMSTVVMDGGRFAGPQTVRDLDLVFIDSGGVIYGEHAVHGRLLLGRIDIATFQNVNGLQEHGTSYYKESLASGAAEVKQPESDGAGEIVSGALEMANVDLSQEFSDMIITQRGFQANSRIITVSDTMLEELINLKR